MDEVRAGTGQAGSRSRPGGSLCHSRRRKPVSSRSRAAGLRTRIGTVTEPQQAVSQDSASNEGVPDTVAAWEERYAGTGEAIWSGNPNESLVAVARGLTPGRVLDVGCGEGADVTWLAEQGWDATGIDLSQTAIDRAGEIAEAKGVSVKLEVADITTWSDPEPRRGGFDLVLGCFLHPGCPTPGKNSSAAWLSTLHRAAEFCSSPMRRCRTGPRTMMTNWATDSAIIMNRSPRTETSPCSSAAARLAGRSNWVSFAPARSKDRTASHRKSTTASSWRTWSPTEEPPRRVRSPHLTW